MVSALRPGMGARRSNDRLALCRRTHRRSHQAGLSRHSGPAREAPPRTDAGACAGAIPRRSRNAPRPYCALTLSVASSPPNWCNFCCFVLLTDSAKVTAPVVQDASAAVPQPVVQVLTNAAVFLVVTIKSDAASLAALRAFGGDDLPALVRGIGFRDLGGQ